MKKLVMLLLGMISLSSFAQTSVLPSVTSLAFASHLSSPTELRYTSAFLSKEALYKFSRLDSSHAVFPLYSTWVSHHAGRDEIRLSTWNGWFIYESTEEVKETSFLVADVDSLTEGHYSLLVEPNVHSNHGDFSISAIRVGTSDWQNYSSLVAVDIPAGNASISLAVRYVVDGEMRETGIEIPVNHRSTYELNTSPWPVNAGSNYEISTQYAGNEVKGNAYVRLSADGVFDKPFLFVEGIDFGHDHSATRNGTFGWETFTRENQNPQYTMLNQIPEFLDDLYAHGYDVVLLDFYDGSADIRSNAALLKQLLRLCNQYKTGTASNVVAGASMGGVISRVALREMEIGGEEHCTRLYISLDAPHLGAYIPISLQSSIDFFSGVNASAANFVSNNLERPAAKQLLIYQWFASNQTAPADYVSFQAYLNQIGFPKRTRNVAIANGDEEDGLGYEVGSELMNVHCNASNLFSGDEFRCVMYPIPGSPDYVENTSTARVVSDNKFSEVDLSWTGISVSTLTGVSTFSSTAKPLDYANGGYSTAVHEFVQALNASADFNGNCGQINIDQYKVHHCFVPTYSSLAMADRDVFESVVDGNSPFDEFFVQSEGNQPHSMLTHDNLAFIKEEVLGMENDNGSSLWEAHVTNHEDFNFGPHGVQQMTGADLTNIVVSIGKLGFANNEYNSSVYNGDHVEVAFYRGCANNILDIQEGAAVEVGSEEGSVDARFVVSEGTEVWVSNGGVLHVQPGGTLVLKSGSLLNLNGGALQIDGRIQLEAGARMLWNNGTFDATSEVVFGGGELRVAPHVHAVMRMHNSSCSLVPHALVRFNLALAATLSVVGEDAATLNMGDGAEWIIDGSGDKFTLSKMQVNQSADSRVNAAVYAEVRNSDLTRTANAKWDQSYSDMYSFQSNWNGGQVHVLKGGLRWTEVQATNALHAVVSYGTLRVDNCVFDSADLISEFLLTTASIKNSLFMHTPVAYSDYSLVDVHVDFTSFESNGIGIQKKGGILSLRCNAFNNHTQAITLGKGTVLNMSSYNGAGYNAFSNSDEHIHFYHAGTPQLAKGFNQFTQTGHYNLVGNIATLSCSENCLAPSLNTTMNYFHPVASLPQGVWLFTSSNCNGSQPCAIGVSPNASFDGNCPTGVTHLSPGKSLTKHLEEKTVELPLVMTTAFGVLPLDSALAMSASLVFEQLDSMANYKGALKALHEVLIQPLDRGNASVRKLMDWGMFQMKNNLESMIQNKLIQPSAASFDISTQRYVDVLNACTDEQLSDTTFRSQFWVELSKAQLFRSVGNATMALYILDRLNTCNLKGDELEQLNYWRNLTAMELSLLTQAPEALVNDSSYNSLSDDAFHFGVHILSPTHVVFESCFNAVKQQAVESGMVVFPTLTTGSFVVESEDAIQTMSLIDLAGRVVHRVSGNASNRMNVRVEVDPGIYLVKVVTVLNNVHTIKIEVLR